MTPAVAPFSFHCIICIEAFNFDDRPPVILPCGHTFICEQCAKRIDKCMECRTSLFLKQVTVPSQPSLSSGSTSFTADLSSSSSLSSSNDGQHFNNMYPQYPVAAPGTPVSRRQRQQIQKLAARYGTSPPQHFKKAETQPTMVNVSVPLPLPKNLVLLELMEASAKREMHSLQSRSLSGSACNSFERSPNNSLMDEGSDHSAGPEMDEEKVLSSIDVMASTCGTYVVKERCGLALHSLSAANVSFLDEGMDVNLVVNATYDDLSSPEDSSSGAARRRRANRRGNGRTMSGRSGGGRSNTMNILPSKPIAMLTYGQRVQIVEVKNGVYRLARNQGLIFAEPTQMVKVGTPQEISCKVEGMVRAIESAKLEISQKMENLAFTESNLKSELDQLLSLPETEPVISDPPPPPAPEKQQLESNSNSRDDDITEPEPSRQPEFSRPPQAQSQTGGRSTPSDKFLSSSISASGDSQAQTVDTNFFPTNFISDESIGTATPTPATPPTLATPRSRKILFEDTANTVIGAETRLNEDDVDGSPFRNMLMCGVQTSLVPLFRKLDGLEEEGDDDTSRLPIRRMDSDDTSLQGRNSTFESVDFRTGFSGHVGMNHARKARRAFPMQTQMRLMADHRGIARINRVREKPGVPASPVSEKKSWL